MALAGQRTVQDRAFAACDRYVSHVGCGNDHAQIDAGAHTLVDNLYLSIAGQELSGLRHGRYGGG